MAFAGSLALHDGALPQSDRIWLERRFGNDTGGDAGLALSAGPLAAADPVQTGLARSGRGLLAFVGYLAHGADLASALGAPRAAQTGLGPADLDAALALAAFERWGLDAASRLEGGFALVWWQPHQRQMVLMTDIMGQRPIYACLERGILRFATSLPLLLGWPGVPLDIDAAHMAGELAGLRSAPASRTHFSAIAPIPAASLWSIARGQIARQRYWRIDPDRRSPVRRADDAAEAVRTLLDRAVAGCLPHDGPIVAQMSGGLDSTAVATSAARQIGSRILDTVTTVYDNQALAAYDQRHFFADERAHAEAIAAIHGNIRAHFVEGGGPHRYETELDAMFALSGAPRPNMAPFLWYQSSFDHVRAMGARVLLKGQLGNVVLSWGGAESRTEIIRAMPVLRRLSEARAWSAGQGLAPLRLMLSWGIGPLLSPRLRAVLERWRKRGGAEALWPAGPVSVTPLAPMADDLIAPGRGADWFAEARSGSVRDWRLALLALNQCMGESFHRGDLLAGLERRHPFADRGLLEFCFALPDDHYVRGGVDRYLARRVLADRLPPRVLTERRSGLQAHDQPAILRRRRRQVIAGVEALAEGGLAGDYIDVPRLKTMVRNWPETDAGLHWGYWAPLYRAWHYAGFLSWVERGCPA